MTELDDNVKEIFETFKIPCYGNHGQITKRSLGYNTARPGEHLELDFVARINRVGLILEVTAEKRNQRREMRKFVDHCQEFVKAPIGMREKIRLLCGIPRRARQDFETITEWRYVYIGTSEEIIQLQLDETAFPGQPLCVLNREHYEYLRFLCDRLGEFGKYEFVKGLDISPQEAGETATEIRVDTISLIGRKISKGMDLVDLYAFETNVSHLLKVARVVRYGSLESWVPEIGTEAYQRLLSPDKLRRIREFLKKERGKSSFPNAITVVLSPNVRPAETGNVRKLVIPLEYGSIEVIDGQHRLFAFAKCGLRSDQLEEAKLLVIGVRFRDYSVKKQQQWSARTFIEINRSQTKVPTELIQLIANSVMGETTPTALAARVLVNLNLKRGPLGNVFHTRPFQKLNRVGGRPVRLVTVTEELASLLDLKNSEQTETLGIYRTFSDEAWRALERGRPDKIISECQRVVNEYFGWVSNIFRADWNSKDSLVFTSKYMAALCKILIEFKKRGFGTSRIRNRLNQTKTNIESYLRNNGKTLGSKGEILWKENAAIPGITSGLPSARGSFSEIYEFLSKQAQLS